MRILYKLRVAMFLRFFVARISKGFDKSDLLYLTYNYLGVLLTVFSGVFVARHLGAIKRGELAYIANFLALAGYMSSMNLSTGISTAIRKEDFSFPSNRKEATVPGTNLSKLLMAGCASGLVTTLCIFAFSFKLVSINTQLQSVWYLLAILPLALSACIALVEGVMRVIGDTHYFRVARLLGLGIPALFTMGLFAFGKAKIALLVFTNAITLFFVLIFALYKLVTAGLQTKVTIRNTYSLSLRGFSYSFLDVLGSWAIYLVIAHSDGKASLGNYAIAMSFYGLSESIFPNLEAKNHTELSQNSLSHENRQKKIFSKNLKKMFTLKIIFIPFSFTIVILYGHQFVLAAFYAVIMLVLGIPLTYSKYVNTIALSRAFLYIPGLSQLIYLGILLLMGFYTPHLFKNFNWLVALLFATLIQALFTKKITASKLGFLNRNKN